MLCEQSETVLFGRDPLRAGLPRGTPQRGPTRPRYTYVNAHKLFHFSPVE